MAPKIPWDYYDVHQHFFPPEEYQLSRVTIDEVSGKEEVIHYSRAEFEYDIHNDVLPNFMYGHISSAD
ncbi:hypothetical protein BHF71_06050 [Vulcanibacillus modesticaldus]|uniref:Uncharacterized protein n=1 Tax=Vulcanibacillus modesticaldus TaxID=337097 RepID=A0A1D2YX13_9BACI|nr:hypothetical protein [Vulcanibacillus modesticaldus]OEG00163.1 hypothetical protein BHF71_06050 [Vulcanibacillus modesticaldus]